LEPGPPKELVADVQQTYRWLWVGAVEKGLDWIGLERGDVTINRQLFWWSSTFWGTVSEFHRSSGFQFVVHFSMTNGRLGIYTLLGS
jgi:hypothetical protein